jgi:hypothetical protein
LALEGHPQFNDERMAGHEFQYWQSRALSIASELDPREKPLDQVIRLSDDS